MAEPVKANDHQVGGEHYRLGGGHEQHWDRLIRLFGWYRAKVYFIGNVTAYAERHEQKGGLQDLKKMAHYAQKIVEEEEKWLAEIDQQAKEEVKEELRAKLLEMAKERERQKWVPHTFGVPVVMVDSVESSGEDLDEAVMKAARQQLKDWIDSEVGTPLVAPKPKEWWAPYASPEEFMGAMFKTIPDATPQTVKMNVRPIENICPFCEGDLEKVVNCHHCFGSGIVVKEYIPQPLPIVTHPPTTIPPPEKETPGQ